MNSVPSKRTPASRGTRKPKPHDRGVLDGRERVRDLAARPAEDLRRLVGGRRHHHPLRANAPVATGTRQRDLPVGPVAPQGRDTARQHRRLDELIREIARQGTEALRRRVGAPQAAFAAPTQRGETAQGNRAVAPLEIDEPPEDRLGAELLLVSGVDAGQERSDEAPDRLRTETAARELGHRLTGGVPPANEGLRQQAQLAAGGEKRRSNKRER
jgi:hypothetical protein